MRRLGAVLVVAGRRRRGRRGRLGVARLPARRAARRGKDRDRAAQRAASSASPPNSARAGIVRASLAVRRRHGIARRGTRAEGRRIRIRAGAQPARGRRSPGERPGGAASLHPPRRADQRRGRGAARCGAGARRHDRRAAARRQPAARHLFLRARHDAGRARRAHAARDGARACRGVAAARARPAARRARSRR